MDLPTELLRPVIQNMKIIFTVIFALIFIENSVSCLNLSEYAKFRGIRAIVVFVVFRAIVPPCLRGSPKFFLKGISLVQNLFSWVFCGSKIFSLSLFRGSKIFPCKYFVGPKYFSVVIFWVRNSFSCVFRGPNIFHGEYFVGPKFLREGVLWVQNIFSWSFVGSIVVTHLYFIGSTFFLMGISLVRNCFFIGDNFVVHAKDLSLNRVYLMRSFNHWVPIVQCKSGQNLVI